MPKKISYKEGGSNTYFKPQAGGYPAIIVGVMELGTEMKSYKEGDEPKAVTELRLVYEIEAEQEIYDKDEEKLTGEMHDVIGLIGQNYTEVVSDKSNLGKVIKNVYDVASIKEIKNFSLDKLLGLKCYIEVDLVGKEKNFEVVKSVSSASKKLNFHEQVRENFYFGMEDENDFSEELLNDRAILKPWDKERIENSPEYRKLFGLESLDDQESNMKKEAETRKEEQAKANAVETVSADEAGTVFE